MGVQSSKIPEEKMEQYLSTTNLTRREIERVHKRYHEIDHDNSGFLEMTELLKIPELKVNPWGKRLCQIFSGRPDGRMTFDNFLQMTSVFSENAPLEVKVEYCFRLYDMDNDGVISYRDLHDSLQLLLSGSSHTQLSPEHMHTIVSKVLKESDLDGSQDIGPSEFTKIMSRVPDFASKFRITM